MRTFGGLPALLQYRGAVYVDDVIGKRRRSRRVVTAREQPDLLIDQIDRALELSAFAFEPRLLRLDE